MPNAIGENAYRRELARNEGRDIVVGVNKYVDDTPTEMQLQRIDQQGGLWPPHGKDRHSRRSLCRRVYGQAGIAPGD